MKDNKLLSVFLVFILVIALLASFCIDAAAVPAVFVKMGDVGMDGKVDIADATKIQRALAGLTELSVLQECVADINHNGEADVMDAALIQRELVKLKSDYSDSFLEDVYYYVMRGRLEITSLSDALKAGEEIHIHAEAFTDERFLPLTYEYSIDEEIVQSRCESPDMVTVFNQPGVYMVSVKIYNTANAYHTANKVLIIH